MKTKTIRVLWFLGALLLAHFSVILWFQFVNANSVSVSGLVIDAAGPVPGATVRVRATDNMTYTDSNGLFTLTGLLPDEVLEITAWAEGYYVTSMLVTPTVSGISLTLRRYHTNDHPEYEWISPISGSSEKACGNCHPMILPQWESNAHGQAISNPRFFSFYNGTNISGTVLVGSGYLRDFPGTAGNCANCHAPGAGVDGYLKTDMNVSRGDITAGIHCDYCHKVGGVYLDQVSGSVYPNAPGVRSQNVLRPPSGDNIFFGPYDDIPDPDTYLPVTTQSQFCAPCHQFSFWGTPIYESYNEWLASSYSTEGITCQDCHMPPNGDSYFALPEVGGLSHSPELIPSHLQLGANSTDLLQDTVAMSVDISQDWNLIQVIVTITNTNAGHHVPTDHPGRHLILTVEMLDSNKQPLTQIAGNQVPLWGGDQAGKAGNAYAKVLQDVVSGEFPVVSYWKQTLLVGDSRIPAMGSDTSIYTFAAPANENKVTVNAVLRFRRMFQPEMDSKGWEAPDIVMEEAHTSLSVQPLWDNFFPLVIMMESAGLTD